MATKPHMMNAINLDQNEALAPNAQEVARLWVQHRGPATIFLNPNVLTDPAMVGMLLADTARHAARAYAQALGLSEQEAMARVWEGFDHERARPTSDLDQIGQTEGNA